MYDASKLDDPAKSREHGKGRRIDEGRRLLVGLVMLAVAFLAELFTVDAALGSERCIRDALCATPRALGARFLATDRSGRSSAHSVLQGCTADASVTGVSSNRSVGIPCLSQISWYRDFTAGSNPTRATLSLLRFRS